MINTNLKNDINDKITSSQSKNIRERFDLEREDNGWIERGYDIVKNKLNLGVGSNRVLKDIDRFENGEITEKQVQKTIDLYKSSQETSYNLVSDIISVGISGAYLLCKDAGTKETITNLEIKNKHFPSDKLSKKNK